MHLCSFLISQLSFLSATDLHLFDSGQGLVGLGIALPPMQEEWRPSLQRVMTSVGESRLVVVRPSLLGFVSSRPVVSTAAVVAAVMAMIPVVMAEVGSEVTLMVPPLTVAVEERKETGLPASPDGGVHGLPTWSELEGFDGTTVRLDVE